MTKFSLLIIIKFINERVSKRSAYRNLSRETTNLYFFALYNQQIVYFCNMKAEDIEKQDGQKWQSVNQLLSQAGSHLNILEEEIDIDVQHQYMDLLEHLIHGGNFKVLREDAIVHAQDLFDEAVDDEKKKT